MVARPVQGKEKVNNPAAKASLDKEWNRLESIPTWDMNGVKEWSDVQDTGDNHVGALMPDNGERCRCSQARTRSRKWGIPRAKKSQTTAR